VPHLKATLAGINPLFSPQARPISVHRGRGVFRSSPAEFRATVEAAHRPSSGAVVPAVRNRLHSWKEIAAYLKCEVRTAQRWEEREGLPIHRHMHRKLSSVFTHPNELDEWWVRRCPPAKENRSRASFLEGRSRLAVLPFENLTDHPGQALFSDGLTEETTTQLVLVLPKRVAVIARTTMFQYKTADKDVNRIGRELRLNYLLEGSVRWNGNRVWITAQLIEVGGETHLWAKVYRGDITDELGTQIAAARRIAHSLKAVLASHVELASSLGFHSARV
jgi:TolB-like protein/DNA-binding transcriptional regulator YiaG